MIAPSPADNSAISRQIRPAPPPLQVHYVYVALTTATERAPPPLQNHYVYHSLSHQHQHQKNLSTTTTTSSQCIALNMAPAPYQAFIATERAQQQLHVLEHQHKALQFTRILRHKSFPTMYIV